MSQVLTKIVAVSFVFCFVKEGRVVENNESDVATLKILRQNRNRR